MVTSWEVGRLCLKGKRWSILSYTDGVTDEPNGDEAFGEIRFGEVLTQIVGRSAQEMADGLMAAVLDFRRGAPRDDIAILVMKMAEEVGTAS